MKNMVHVLSELFFANYFRSFKLLISGFFFINITAKFDLVRKIEKVTRFYKRI